MFRNWPPTDSLRALLVTFLLVATACGGGTDSSQSSPGDESNADDAEVSESRSRSFRDRVERAAEAAKDHDEGASVGNAAFVVNGEAKRFGYLPEKRAVYTSLASTVVAFPEAGAKEMLTITISGVDLKERTYPQALPPARDPGGQMSIQQAMQSVGLSYVAPDGTEWAGPAKIRIESFDSDGVLRGAFDTASLPHTDRELPNATLSAGTFEARITAPW